MRVCLLWSSVHFMPAVVQPDHRCLVGVSAAPGWPQASSAVRHVPQQSIFEWECFWWLHLHPAESCTSSLSICCLSFFYPVSTLVLQLHSQTSDGGFIAQGSDVLLTAERYLYQLRTPFLQLKETKSLVMMSSFSVQTWRKLTLSGAGSCGGRSVRRCAWRLNGKTHCWHFLDIPTNSKCLSQTSAMAFTCTVSSRLPAGRKVGSSSVIYYLVGEFLG